MPTTTLRRRQLLTGALAGAAAASLPRLALAAAPIRLRVSSSAPPDRFGAHYLWYKPFEDQLKQLVGDRVVLEYFPNGQLGKEADVVQQVKTGSVDMMMTGLSIWSTVVPEVGMLDYGYLFDNYKHAATALDGGVAAALEGLLQQRTGVSVLGWGFQVGSRSVYTKTPKDRLPALKGTKLRVLPTKGLIDTFDAMGATPTPIPINEVYTAVQTGVVDGYEHDPGTVLAYKWFEVSTNCLLTRHMYSTMCAFIGKRGLAKIPDDLKPAFLQAAKAATVSAREQAAATEDEVMADLKKKGIVFTELPAAQRQAISQKIAQTLHPEFIAKYPATKPLFDKIAAVRQA
ncbi:MAG: 2,3-diketo-L-gulonate-binding periplasmic protein YiaO [Paracidovorax wautersii]|uniref:2,3-diketo-L-gulonate-binding periplasmic protein YiaO n=1 Tax=Paracidovorax wautersii TaxID=1177982 RepID=A0A7V8FL07_9BURK|nr:MAG: 2,3-diketo-L-gulonate-binding periplasmic protein YiaO [Paracidovorax wautersii]